MARTRFAVRVVHALSALSLVVVATARCTEPYECLRQSDCELGYACVNGVCTDPSSTPPPVASADAAAAEAAASAVADAAGDAQSATVAVPDASGDSGATDAADASDE